MARLPNLLLRLVPRSNLRSLHDIKGLTIMSIHDTVIEDVCNRKGWAALAR